MTNNPPTEKGSDVAWRVELFRLTVFFLPEDRINPTTWWETITGEPPEQRNSQPRMGMQQDEGAYHGGRLVLTVQPDRADWLFIPAIDEATKSAALDQLPDYETALNIFQALVKRWFEISPPCSRIAFGNVLNSIVPNRPTGYRLLSRYLPSVQIDPENSSDFTYQINRPRSSKSILGLGLNRLSKWSVLITKFGQFSMGPVIQEFVVSSNDLIFARVELDINTVAENKKPFSPEQRSMIFSELVELAYEIAEQGDIP